MLHLVNAAFLILQTTKCNKRIFTIPENVTILTINMNKYELRSNYIELKKEQYRSIIEC
jgi:hypothetical protein